MECTVMRVGILSLFFVVGIAGCGGNSGSDYERVPSIPDPTLDPTLAPTLEPTLEPGPTAVPSTEPTLVPTLVPTTPSRM